MTRVDRLAVAALTRGHALQPRASGHAAGSQDKRVDRSLALSVSWYRAQEEESGSESETLARIEFKF